ncbi:MAG: TonB-dependent receptor [Saprospiraceae bacterium]|nr:TonB-dependent receptor [Saprospiraceae bacterium]
MKNIIKAMSLSMLLWTGNMAAQNQEVLLLKDQNTLSPITEANFTYGTQTGVSDNEGTIKFVLEENASLSISHLNYGKWHISESQLNETLTIGVLYRESQGYTLYPVTVIAVRPNNKPNEKVQLEYQDRMAHDGASILERSPSINSIRKGGSYGFDPVLRGFKYDQVNIVLNGSQSCTAACPNRMDPPSSQMAPNMIDRIEILKGPHALRYGTGFGGTINFVPSKPRFSQMTSQYGRISGSYDSNGNIIRSEGLIGLNGQKYDFGFFGSWSQGNDYEAGDNTVVGADFLRGSFGSRLGVKIGQDQNLKISANYNMARDADFPALPMDLREDDTWMFNAQHKLAFKNENLKTWNTTLYASFVDHIMDNRLKPLDPRMLNAETVATTSNYGGRTEGNWKYKNGNLYLGADLRSENAEGIRTREFLLGPNAGKTINDNAWQNGRITKTALFGEYHFRTNNWQYVASTRIEYNSSKISDPDAGFLELNPDPETHQTNPNLSLGAFRQIGKYSKVGVWVGNAQRSGSLTERYINYFPVGLDPYELVGNPDLDAEKNNQLDLTFNLTKDSNQLDIDVFTSYIRDYISSRIDTTLSPRIPSSPGVRQFQNIEKVFKTGGEINWNYKWNHYLQQNLGLAYTYAQDLENDEPLPEIAPFEFIYSLYGLLLEDKLQTEISIRHAFKQSRISREFGETETPSFSKVDIKLSYQLSDHARFSAGINNLLNESYYEHLSRSVRGTQTPILAPGRNIFTSFNVRF